MYIKCEKIENIHYRISKSGVKHSYIRVITYVHLMCDNCEKLFKRPKSKINPKRLNNNYFHCCSDCDSKKFAQKKGLQKRIFWNMPVSTTTTIDNL